MQYTRVTIGRSEDGTLQSVGNCVSSGTTSTIIASLLFAVNLVVVVFAIIQVYQTRRVTVAYHESKVSVYKFMWAWFSVLNQIPYIYTFLLSLSASRLQGKKLFYVLIYGSRRTFNN